MIPEAAQAAAETIKSSSYITGQFVIDGALLIAGLKVVEAVISKVRTRKNGGPKPGDGQTCKIHGEKLVKHDTEIEAISKQMGEWRKENREDHNKIFDLFRAGK